MLKIEDTQLLPQKFSKKFQFFKTMKTFVKLVTFEQKCFPIIGFDDVNTLNIAWNQGNLKNSFTYLRQQYDHYPQKIDTRECEGSDLLLKNEYEAQVTFSQVEYISLFKDNIKPLWSQEENKNLQTIGYDLENVGEERGNLIWQIFVITFVLQAENFLKNLNGVCLQQGYMKDFKNTQVVHSKDVTLQLWFSQKANQSEVLESIEFFNKLLGNLIVQDKKEAPANISIFGQFYNEQTRRNKTMTYNYATKSFD